MIVLLVLLELMVLLVLDVTERFAAEESRREFTANVSHELKTPLTSITNSVFSIRKSCKEGEGPSKNELLTWSGRMEENAVRMQDIVNDFLVLSQCSHTSRMGIFDIRDAVSQAYKNVCDYPGAEKVLFTLPDEETAYPLLYGNSKLIVRTIVNLLTNAIKYINFEGKVAQNQVHISISVIDDRVAVQVDDNGRGIPAKDIEHLFERFYRVDNSGSREVGGSGIGLAIAKEIADMHDGVISVTSTFGQGATFIFSLPTAKTVFEGVFNDAKAGIISDKPLNRAAAYFLGLQVGEAVRSLGYKDIEGLVDEYEIIPEHEVATRDKALTKLLGAFGNERFEELIDELLYVEDDSAEDGPVTGLDQDVVLETMPEAVSAAPSQPIMPMAEQLSVPMEMLMPTEPAQPVDPQIMQAPAVQPQVIPPQPVQPQAVQPQAVQQPASFADDQTAMQGQMQMTAEEAEALAQEEALRLQAKEEARKLLTQPVVQISAEQRKTVSQLNRESREKHVIHPISGGKRYNGKSAASGDKGTSPDSEHPNKGGVAVKSSLKKILDDSNPHNG